MLKGISPVISPELLMTIAEMGHGDEIVIADAHFPGHTFNGNVVRADGLDIPQLSELGSAAEVQAFCEINYGLDLPMTDILPVRGAGAHPFFRAVRAETPLMRSTKAFPASILTPASL